MLWRSHSHNRGSPPDVIPAFRHALLSDVYGNILKDLGNKSCLIPIFLKGLKAVKFASIYVLGPAPHLLNAVEIWPIRHVGDDSDVFSLTEVGDSLCAVDPAVVPKIR